MNNATKVEVPEPDTMMKRLVRPRFRMATGMIRRAVRHGIRASCVGADAWFGNKDMMRAAKLARANTQLCLSYCIHPSLRHSLSHVSGHKDDINRIIYRTGTLADTGSVR